jgi:hypothetical protein
MEEKRVAAEEAKKVKEAVAAEEAARKAAEQTAAKEEVKKAKQAAKAAAAEEAARKAAEQAAAKEEAKKAKEAAKAEAAAQAAAEQAATKEEAKKQAAAAKAEAAAQEEAKKQAAAAKRAEKAKKATAKADEAVASVQPIVAKANAKAPSPIDSEDEPSHPPALLTDREVHASSVEVSVSMSSNQTPSLKNGPTAIQLTPVPTDDCYVVLHVIKMLGGEAVPMPILEDFVHAQGYKAGPAGILESLSGHGLVKLDAGSERVTSLPSSDGREEALSQD